jgi:hypothetical protein
MIEVRRDSADHRRYDVEQQYARPDAAEEDEGAEEDEEQEWSATVAEQDKRAGEEHDPRLRTGDWRGGGGEGDADRNVFATGQRFGSVARGS